MSPSATDDERGAVLVEYALLMALIVLACFAAVSLYGSSTEGLYSSIVDSFPE